MPVCVETRLPEGQTPEIWESAEEKELSDRDLRKKYRAHNCIVKDTSDYVSMAKMVPAPFSAPFSKNPCNLRNLWTLFCVCSHVSVDLSFVYGATKFPDKFLSNGARYRFFSFFSRQLKQIAELGSYRGV
jgi:hypothetical protein